MLELINRVRYLENGASYLNGVPEDRHFAGSVMGSFNSGGNMGPRQGVSHGVLWTFGLQDDRGIPSPSVLLSTSTTWAHSGFK